MSSVNIVAHNLQGMFTNRQLGIVNTDKKKSSEKLSTGYKINRAADDAAGLSISEKMRKHIRGLNQGSKNISDGVNYCQIADGAMAEINEMLARMKVLAINSANGTMSSSDRADTNNEIQYPVPGRPVHARTGKSEQSGDFIAFGVTGKCHVILNRPMLYSSAG